jgi:sarcosine oxidase gamma subunit
MLARGCRLDLDPVEFPAGHAAATHMAQVSVIIAALPSGIMLLTPATTARHVREWLASTAQPFGFAQRPAPAVGDLYRTPFQETPT